MSYDCYCDYDAPEFHRRTTSKARKQHKCCECCAPIFIGEKYEYVIGKWEGQVDTFKTCQLCADLRIWVENNIPCACWHHGNMHDELWQNIEDAVDRAPKETVGIRFGFRRRLWKIQEARKEKKARGTAPD